MNGNQNQQQYQYDPSAPQNFQQSPPQHFQQVPYQQPKRKKKKLWPWIVGGAAVVILFSAFSGGGSSDTSETSISSSSSAPANLEPAMEVTATSMVFELDSNALKAKQTYEGKRVAVSGEVSAIDASGKYFSVKPSDDTVTLTTIRADLQNDAQKAQLVELTQGADVTVTGEVTGVGEIMGYSIEVESIN